MTTTRSTNDRSVDVRMQQLLNGHVLQIAQLGPRFLMLDHPIEHPPADAKILMSVGGKEERRCVRLPNGISTTAPATAVSPPVR